MVTETLAAAISSVILADSLAHFKTIGVMNAFSAITLAKLRLLFSGFSNCQR
jgi:hypothetical protein